MRVAAVHGGNSIMGRRGMYAVAYIMYVQYSRRICVTVIICLVS